MYRHADSSFCKLQDVTVFLGDQVYSVYVQAATASRAAAAFRHLMPLTVTQMQVATWTSVRV